MGRSEVEIFRGCDGPKGSLRTVIDVGTNVRITNVRTTHEIAVDDARDQQAKAKASGGGNEVAAFHEG